LIPARFPIQRNQAATPPLGDMPRFDKPHRFPAKGNRHHFSAMTSFFTSISNQVRQAGVSNGHFPAAIAGTL
jgi:hypothetical protein